MVTNTSTTEYPLVTSLLNAIGDKSINITTLPLAITKEIQSILQKMQLYSGAIDGIPGNETIDAWGKFKSTVWLADLELVGRSSLLALLEERHPVSEQSAGVKPLTTKILPNAGTKTGATMRIPRGIVYANEFIVPGVPLTWGEFTKDCTRVPNSNELCANAVKFAQNFGWVRDKWGSPIGITSGYRPPAVNRAIGGARYSRHMQGDAGDIFPTKGSIYDLLNVIKASNFTGIGLGMYRGFIHADCRPTIRVIFNY